LRIPLAAIVGAGVALVAASMLGVASAEAPTTALTRSIDVQGVAKAPVGQGANAAAATAAYRTAMASAVADAQNKAEFLAAKAGVTLGAPQTIAEDGGFIDCAGGGESGFVEYEGEQPDFGTAGPAVGGVRLAAPAAPAGAPVRPKPAIKRRHRKHRRTAKTALSATCTLTAQVSIAYAIS
jgi:hypothetical protein